MTSRTGTAILAAALWVSATGGVWAQPAGHHDEAGIRAALLTNRSVQHALKLDAAQAEKVARLAKDVAAKGRAAAKEFGALPEAERIEKMHGVMTATCKEAMGTLRGLLSAEQYKRYDQIVLQQRGIMAFADPEIQEKLKLTREQKGRIHELAKGLHGQMLELAHNASPGKIEELHEQGLVLHWKAIDQAVAVLGDDQQATWKELIGDRFDVKLEDHPASNAR